MTQPATLLLAGELKPPYRPRVPQQSVYYRLVEEHFEQLERVVPPFLPLLSPETGGGVWSVAVYCGIKKGAPPAVGLFDT